MSKVYHKRGVPIEGYWPVTTHPLYKTWQGIIQRCENPYYPSYHGRGISVCKKWRNSFPAFLSDMGPKPTPDHSIDRRNNNGNYTPKNCRWATYSEQCLNRRVREGSRTGEVGITSLKNGRFTAVFSFEYERYDLGRFDSAKEALKARKKFIAIFEVDRVAAVASIVKPTLWCTSHTKERCISENKKTGKFQVATQINNVRYYVGYYETLEIAKNERDRFLKEKKVSLERRIAQRNYGGRLKKTDL